ncbi:hypothetical protein GQ53DRAFT_746074 [Thozetella sp. PMI_491]|nr:hypothetical protein GQ53DRAFT_746074 [Thozetella sp. PMI_491]
MMASPSSTAAYLMHVTDWDDEVETYLKHVIQYGVGSNSGAVPSAFPSMFFEYTWVSRGPGARTLRYTARKLTARPDVVHPLPRWVSRH